MEHVIKNFDALVSNNRLREDALTIAEAGYAAIDVGNALRRTLHVEGDTLTVAKRGLLETRTSDVLTFPLAKRHIFFVGVGKCAFSAAPVIEEMFGERLTKGIALDVSSLPTGLKKIEALVGTHPLPSKENVRATKRILDLLEAAREGDLVIILVSGGGSTLLAAPAPGMTAEGETAIFKALTVCGTPIRDLNIVRKHLSRARGGGLARAAYPALVLALIASDVPGDDLATISSGPTVRDDSTAEEAEAILARAGTSLPAGASFIETPKDAWRFERVTNVLFLAGRDALAAMQDAARARGYAVTIAARQFSGEASALARSIAERLHAAVPKAVLLHSGESTVRTSDVLVSVHGGRNQELALAALEEVREDELILPFASDGRDNGDYAGAIADRATQEHARDRGLSIEDALAHHASTDFFTASGDALETGYTGTNVSDLIVALKR